MTGAAPEQRGRGVRLAAQRRTRRRRRRAQRGVHRPKRVQRLQWARTRRNEREDRRHAALLPARWKRAPASTVATGRRKFGQVEARCGETAINNLFGQRVVAASDLHALAAQQNARAVKNNETARHGDARGNWSPSVLRRALNQKGYRMDVVGTPDGNVRSHMWLGAQRTGKFLVLGRGGGHAGHWFAVDADAGLIIDSATKPYILLNAAGVLKGTTEGVSALFRVPAAS